MQLKFSNAQADWAKTIWDFWIWHYFQVRYGRAWYWYWMNWEHNQEIML